MKKVLVLAVVALGAFVAQASTSYSWSSTWTGEGFADFGTNGALMLVYEGAQRDSILSLVQGETWSDATVSTLKSSAVETNTFKIWGTSAGITSHKTTIENGDTLFWLLVENGSFESGTILRWSDALTYDQLRALNTKMLTKNLPSVSTQVLLYSGTIPEKSGGDVVPEPGVLGLLALGVAGLALRRKVA